jgi:hypothetical protein
MNVQREIQKAKGDKINSKLKNVDYTSRISLLSLRRVHAPIVTPQFIRFKTWLFLNQFATLYEVLRFHPSNGATAQIGPWPPL